MDSDRVDVLSLNEVREDSGDFSGFSPLHLLKQSTSKEKEKKKGKSVASKNKTTRKKRVQKAPVTKKMCLPPAKVKGIRRKIQIMYLCWTS